MSGNQIARYFERVLGARKVAAFDMGPVVTHVAVASDVTASRGVEMPAAVPSQAVCLLVEVGSGSETPSLQQMGSRLLEAIRSEWIKKSSDNLPEMEWIQASPQEWAAAVGERNAAVGSHVQLAIVCGAQGSHDGNTLVLHVPSFAEMQGNPVQKRDAWRAIQGAIAKASQN